jgi:uncharacterized MnhB-related membrane protein
MAKEKIYLLMKYIICTNLELVQNNNLDALIIFSTFSIIKSEQNVSLVHLFQK